MVWLPTASEVLVRLVALPPERVTTLPKFVPSTVNWTVAPGGPAPGAVALTVAVHVTGWLTTDGLADDDKLVVVPAALTFCVKAEAVLSLPLKLVSPL